jgi:hypothetical protein
LPFNFLPFNGAEVGKTEFSPKVVNEKFLFGEAQSSTHPASGAVRRPLASRFTVSISDVVDVFSCALFYMPFSSLTCQFSSWYNRLNS